VPEHFLDRTGGSDESNLGGVAKVLAADVIVAGTQWLRQPGDPAANWSPVDVGANWYDGQFGTRLRDERICRSWYYVPATPAATAPAPAGRRALPLARPQHSEWIPGNSLGDLEHVCGPQPSPTPTAPDTPTTTASPTRTVTPTGTRTPDPTRTPTPTLTPRPVPIYLPIAVNDRCKPYEQTVDVVLVIDASTTMLHHTRAGRPKIEAARDAAGRLFDRMSFPGDQAAVVVFNERATTVVDLTDDRDALRRGLAAIENREFTRIDLGLAEAHRLLATSSRRGVNTPAIILLTDGVNNPVPVEEAIRAADAAKQSGITLFAVGLGEDIDAEAMRRMASSPSDYRYAPDGEDLGPIYEGLAIEIPCPRSAFWAGRGRPEDG
jgi:hypothetical protein